MAPTIDVIIPNYNGITLLPTCLEALRRQTRQDWLVTVVDDGSTDQSLALLAEHYPEVQVLALPTNGGLVRAVNAALAATQACFVVLLNNDTEADPAWLEHLIGMLERFPAYDFAASKLRLFDRRDVLHSAGDGYGWDGVPFNRGVWQVDRGQFDAVSEIFGPCAGAAAYRRSALEAVAQAQAVLDQELFMYCEDVDLNVRARRRGLRTIFVPQAVVYHQLSATGGGKLASYYCGRNFIAVWVKNMPLALLLRSLPWFLLAQGRIALQALRHIRGDAARARLRGQWAGVRLVRALWHKRHIQADDAAHLSPWIGRY